MSFITRCPACATAFKVVSDQLKISEGWVRCGHCQQVFDATLDLQPWWPGLEPIDLPAQAAPQTDPVPPAPVSVPDPVSETPASAPEQPAVGLTENGVGTAVVSPDLAWPTASDRAEPVGPAPEPLSGTPTEPLWSSVAPGEPAVAPAQAPRSEPSGRHEPAHPPAFAAEPDPYQPSFVRQAERRAFWRRPWVRVGLAALVLVLLGLLALQASLHWRDSLAARVPDAQPALEKICAPLECAVAPPRQLEDVVIDSSVLLRRAPGRYTFNVVVRNASALEVATPALELTLTDIHDQVLVRRVLPPQEWPEPRATLAPGAEWPVQFELELASPEAQVMTGYRAILFYP